ncbi:MAG: hypothetical protein WCS99_03695 [Limisphaerales bacterium]
MKRLVRVVVIALTAGLAVLAMIAGFASEEPLSIASLPKWAKLLTGAVCLMWLAMEFIGPFLDYRNVRQDRDLERQQRLGPAAECPEAAGQPIASESTTCDVPAAKPHAVE